MSEIEFEVGDRMEIPLREVEFRSDFAGHMAGAAACVMMAVEHLWEAARSIMPSRLWR